MNPTNDDVDRAIAAATSLQQQGYFARAKTGDERDDDEERAWAHGGLDVSKGAKV